MSPFFRWRVYLDSNFFIRFVESRDEAFLWLIEQASADLMMLYTSELTLAEVLVDPIRLEDNSRAAIYADLLKSDDLLEVVPVSREVVVRSAEVRATIGNKLPDAIHIATAIASSCNVILSSDKRLKLPPGITQIGLEDTENSDLWP